ncbi:hypothetical protein BsWGS_10941 [Bradybaena similaris]
MDGSRKTRTFVQVYMARLQDLLANLLCHEAISLLIYGTALLLLLFYIPYWTRQLLDRTYLKHLAKKARERQLKPEMESPERSPDRSPDRSPVLDHLDVGLLKEDDDAADGHHDDDADKTVVKADNQDCGDVLQKDSDERLSQKSHVSSRKGH